MSEIICYRVPITNRRSGKSLEFYSDDPLVPPIGARVFVCDFIYTWVRSITMGPSLDPPCLVECELIKADEEAIEAAIQEGWHVIG